jgi:hypothetical protein
MRSAGWSCTLARLVGVRGGPELRTLADARSHILKLSVCEQSELRCAGQIARGV